MSGGRYLFVSDLHLDADAPKAVTQFIAFLRNEAGGAAALFILGDLFENWIGDDDDEPVRDRICAALANYTATRAPCFVLRGNRDFLLGAGFERRSGCRLLPDPVRMRLGSRDVLLSHGDLLCTADTSYQRFRSLSRDAGTQRRFLALPLPTRRALARAARHGSRAHIRGMPERLMDVDEGAVTTLLRMGATDLLIHGHTHRPAIHRVALPGGVATRVVLGDWYETGSCLALHADGRYEALGLSDAGAATLSMASSNSRV